MSNREPSRRLPNGSRRFLAGRQSLALQADRGRWDFVKVVNDKLDELKYVRRILLVRVLQLVVVGVGPRFSGSELKPAFQTVS